MLLSQWVDTPESIATHMGSLSPLKLQFFLHLLCLVQSPDEEVIDDHTLLLAIAVNHLQRRTSLIDALFDYDIRDNYL
eukprot:CFRG3473T1